MENKESLWIEEVIGAIAIAIAFAVVLSLPFLVPYLASKFPQ